MRQTASYRRRFFLPGVAAALVTMLVLGGCDPSVTVVNPSDQYRFSLFGTLSVTADTQVIRVEPLGDTTRIGAQPDLDATVVLENLDAGTQVSLNGSFESVSGGIARVHNFKTTHPIQPGTTYRVSVRVGEETVTTATTTTPAQPPTLEHEPDSGNDKPFFLPCSFNFRGALVESENTFTLRASNVEAVAAVKVLYPVDVPGQSLQGLIPFDHYDDVEYREGRELYRISVFYGRDLSSLIGRGQGCPSRSQFEQPYALVEVTAGGPDWPDWRGASINEIARPDTFTNVQGGHGFVGSIYSDTIHVPIQQREQSSSRTRYLPTSAPEGGGTDRETGTGGVR